MGKAGEVERRGCLRQNVERHKPWFGCGDDHGNLGFAGIGRDVLDHRRDQAVVEISRHFDVVGCNFVFAVFAGSARFHDSLCDVDCHIKRVGKVRALLNMSVGDEPKDIALGINGGFVVERSVFEVKSKMSGYPVSAHEMRSPSASTLPCSVARERNPCTVPSRCRTATGSAATRIEKAKTNMAEHWRHRRGDQARSTLQAHRFVDGLGDKAVALEEDTI